MRMMAKANLFRVLIMAVAAALAAGLLVVVAAAQQQPAEAATFKTVTKTFSNDTPITIPKGPGKATPYPSNIKVSGFRKGQIKDVNLTLKNYSHPFPDDVAVLLQEPKGKEGTPSPSDVVVMSDVGDQFGVKGVRLVLDDEAADTLPDESLIRSGTFKPTQGTTVDVYPNDNPRPSVFPAPANFGPYGGDLSNFDFTNPNGTWRLLVYDDSAAFGGRFADGWSITIKARVPT
jgi:hypothetical protein